MRRLAALGAALALLAAPASSAAPKPPVRSWAQLQIQTVVAQGLLGGSASAFRPDDPLTQGELSELVAALTGTTIVPTTDPYATVSIAQLDAKLVRAVGLADSAYRFFRAARTAGLAPPSRFGTEVVARLLGLRPNHPADQDKLEPRPADPATRAEAAYSVAKILHLTGWEVPKVQEQSIDFVLPSFTPWQKRVLTTAVKLVGYPYVWGGATESAPTPFGAPTPAGFDCSGFVWRVYKLQAYSGGVSLADTLRGRTTYAMSGEAPRVQRIPFARLAPADVLFFGSRGPRSKPAEVGHMGIYVGNGWFVHSSENGVAFSTLDGWYRQRFAWARRPLVEAGLEFPA